MASGTYALNEEGYFEDEFGNEIGYCNSCGEEAGRDDECCDDGEVVACE